MSQYTRYPVATGGGGGSGTVTSVSVDSPNSTLTISGSPIVTSGTIHLDVAAGTPNLFAYYDASGVLMSLPNWNVDAGSVPNRYGLRYAAQIDPFAAGANYSISNQFQMNYTPTADNNNDTEVLLQLGQDLDPSNTGFGFGAGGLATRVLDIYATTRSSATFGQVVGANINLNMGDPVITGGSTNGLTGIDVFIGSDQGFDVGGVRGLNLNSNFILGSTVSNGLIMAQANVGVSGSFAGGMSGFVLTGNFDPSNAFSGGIAGFQNNLQISGSIGGGQGLVDNTAFQSGSSVSGDWSSLVAGPQFNVGSTVRSYTAITTNPQFNAPITDDIRGIGVFFTDSEAGTNITGLDISINNALATTGNVNGININISNSTDSNPQGVTGISSNGRLQINATTELKSNQGFQIGSRLEHAFSIPLGSPVTNTDSLAVNIAGDFLVQDDVSNGGFGIGLNSVGFISSMGVAAGKNVESITVFLPAAALPDPGYATGGSVDEFHHVRIFPPLPQGGTLSIDNIYAFKIDSAFGDYSSAATNAWGLYLDTDSENYFKSSINIGTASKKVANADVALEVGSLKAILLARLTTLEKLALTALAGMVVYDTDLNQMSYYNGTLWVNV